jgi:hypothetical protein
MNHLEQQLDYPFGETLPESGKTVEIAPGVLWIRMGLPFALNHINLWLLEDEVETAQAGTWLDNCRLRHRQRCHP